ncbi:hypothetical protein O181_073817 [Austropuccinia psidii MF-1]|uniref:Reverse transcriptase Ty1/copia-type domain-containing protein n=1 Tax=Austropuccinia psidii MF-1 TaxID=1389203 RepID=A0A9Q3IBE7_9BASI|nr:hypothetical protein [Austropuccinia psidii MF-1]
MVYPLKARSDTPDAVLDAIRQFQVWLCLTPKALQTHNAKEFTSASFVSMFPTQSPNEPLMPAIITAQVFVWPGSVNLNSLPICGGSNRKSSLQASSFHVSNPQATPPLAVPTKHYFKNELLAIDTLPVTKGVAIPEHLGQVLAGLLRHEWRKACEAQFEQMAVQDVCDAVNKEKTMKTIGHRRVFNVKGHGDGSIEKFKARLVAQGDCQRPGVGCTKTYGLTTSLMSLRLVLAHAMWISWTLLYFDVSGAYLYSPIKETVFLEPPTYFCPQLKGKAL